MQCKLTIPKPAGMKLTLEVIFASLTDGAAVRYSVRSEDITGREKDPDDIVHELLDALGCGITAEGDKRCFIHSTSWRFEPRRTVVLTYFVYSDAPLFTEQNDKLLLLTQAAISGGDCPERPRPRHIAEEHVVAHGIRHLSHLVKNNAQNVRGILAPTSILVFQEMESVMAGRITSSSL